MINKKGNTMKVKEWAYDEAEKAVDKIINAYKNKEVNYENAKKQILDVRNVDMLGIDFYNVEEVL